MTTRLGFAAVLACFASAVGCGDGSFGTDVPANTPFDEASPEDLNALCVGISNDLLALTSGPAARTVCTAAGVVIDSFIVACDDVRDACIDDAEPPEVLSCDNINSAAFDACDTTVGELEICMQQLRANVERLEMQVSCGMTRSELAMVDFGDVYPALCTELSQECPALGMLIRFDVGFGVAVD